MTEHVVTVEPIHDFDMSPILLIECTCGWKSETWWEMKVDDLYSMAAQHILDAREVADNKEERTDGT